MPQVLQKEAFPAGWLFHAPFSGELPQKTDVVIEEKPQITDTVFQHAQPLFGHHLAVMSTTHLVLD